jgi:hypothetical protein
MGKVEKFDKETANAVGNEMIEAVKSVGERYGLTLCRSSGKYDDGSLTERYEFRVANADEITFKKYAKLYGLSPDDLGKSFENERGEKLTITGLRTGRSGAVTLRREHDGASRLMKPDFVRDFLTGVDRYADREREALLLKPGDTAWTRDVKPGYLSDLRVEVISVDKRAKTATVKLVNPSAWFNKGVKERVGDKPFRMDLALLEKSEAPFKPGKEVKTATA